MKTVFALAAALVLSAGAARATDAAPAAPSTPAEEPAHKPPESPAPVPAAEHKEGPCGLHQIHKELVSVEKEIRQSPAYGHAHKHYKLALHLIGRSMRQLNHGCAAYKRDLAKGNVKTAGK